MLIEPPQIPWRRPKLHHPDCQVEPIAAPTAADLQAGTMRVTIRVRPGSTRPGVGGSLGGALVVRVAPRATDGKATEAALAAVAKAFGLRRDAVTLVTGAASRTKIVEITDGDPAVLQHLLDLPGPA